MWRTPLATRCRSPTLAGSRAAALKRVGEWGSYFTDEGYEFVEDLRSSRELCIALHAWGAKDAREADSTAVPVGKLHRALDGDGRSPLSRTGLPGFHL